MELKKPQQIHLKQKLALYHMTASDGLESI